MTHPSAMYRRGYQFIHGTLARHYTAYAAAETILRHIELVLAELNFAAQSNYSSHGKTITPL